jgi:hypothetical protein
MNNDGHGPRAHGVAPLIDDGRNGERPTQELLRPEKYLEIGHTPDGCEIIINIPCDPRAPPQHVIFSPAQSRHLAKLLLRKADECR